MNERQNVVVATGVATLILVIVYLCPWRIESSNELQWSPINRPPISYVRSYDDTHGSRGSSRMVSEEAHIAVGILALEVLAVVVAAGLLYVLFADTGEKEDEQEGEQSS